MDFRHDCLSQAVTTVKRASQTGGLVTPCTAFDLADALNRCNFPNVVEEKPMVGRVTGLCKRDENGLYHLIVDATGTFEQKNLYLSHEIGHMIGGHALTGLSCQRIGFISIGDRREREAETIAESLIVVLSRSDLSEYDRSSFRELLESINHDSKAASSWLRQARRLRGTWR